jgi:hypothetical protein
MEQILISWYKIVAIFLNKTKSSAHFDHTRYTNMSSWVTVSTFAICIVQLSSNGSEKQALTADSSNAHSYTTLPEVFYCCSESFFSRKNWREKFAEDFR